MTNHSHKVRENRARRTAERHGFKLIKSRRRDPQAVGFGGYALTRPDGTHVAGELDTPLSLTLDEVEQHLSPIGVLERQGDLLEDFAARLERTTRLAEKLSADLEASIATNDGYSSAITELLQMLVAQYKRHGEEPPLPILQLLDDRKR